MRIGDVSLVQNSKKNQSCASEVSGENSYEIWSLKVWNRPPPAPVPFRAFFGLLVYTRFTYVCATTEDFTTDTLINEYIINTCIRANVHTNIHTHRHTCIRTYIYTHMHTYIDTYIHTHCFQKSFQYTRIYTRTYKHTYMLTKIQTQHFKRQEEWIYQTNMQTTYTRTIELFFAYMRGSFWRKERENKFPLAHKNNFQTVCQFLPVRKWFAALDSVWQR